MRVLDLDLDYFLKKPVYEQNHSSNSRVTDEDCINSVWSEKEVRTFFEDNLGLSKSKKVKGRILTGHNEALYFWYELIEAGSLIAPFSVMHVDSHADLGYCCLGLSFVLDELIYWPLSCRTPLRCKDYELDGRFYNIDIADYLLFAVAFRWVSSLTYCANPNADAGDIPLNIVIEKIPNYIDKPISLHIKLKSRENQETQLNEPTIPLHIIPTIKDVKSDGDFDFVSIAQSPNYTPHTADFILEIIRDYIEEI